jgi:PST family polysaccharide transporter
METFKAGAASQPVAVPLDPLVEASAAPRTTGDTQRSLDRSLSHGIFWMGGIKAFTQVLAWASTFFVARILQPSDYGLVGLAATFLSIVTTLGEFGIGAAVVARRELDDSQLAQVNTLALLFGVLSFAVCAAGAPVLASFFHAPELRGILIAMGTVFVITGMRVVPLAVLKRDLRFKELALNDGVQVTVVAAGSVLFAVLGFRYWTLVLSAVLAAILSTVLALRLVRMPWHRPIWRDVGQTVQFSRQTVVARLAWSAYSNADFAVAGRALGRDALGAYTFGWNLASTPPDRITTLLSSVTPSILSAVQRDAAALRRYLLVLSEALAMATLPAALGLALVASDLVPVALGTKWLSMVAPLQVLAIAAVIRSVAPLFPQVLTVTGQVGRVMNVNLIGALVLPPAFWIGSHWGTIGIALAWLLVYPWVLVFPIAYTAFRTVELRLPEYIRALRPALVSGGVMVAAVLSTELLRSTLRDAWMMLIVKVAVGAATYAGVLWFGYRSRVLTFAKAIRGARG